MLLASHPPPPIIQVWSKTKFYLKGLGISIMVSTHVQNGVMSGHEALQSELRSILVLLRLNYGPCVVR